MTISTSNLDSGADSPRLARADLLAAVQAINDLLGSAGPSLLAYTPTASYAAGIGQFLNKIYARTADEVSAGVTPTNYEFPPGDVRRYGAIGDDSTNNDSAFNSARLVMAVTAGELEFHPGTYRFASTQTWKINGLSLRAVGKVILKHTGSGTAWALDAGPNPGDGIVFGMSMAGFTITGNASTTNGLLVRGLDHGRIENVRCRDVSAAGILVLRCTATHFVAPIVSSSEGAFSVTPTNGILVADRSGQQTSACTFINPIIEGVSGSGIKLASSGCLRTNFIGGTSEGNGKGIEVLSGSAGNVFIDVDLEGNSSYDIDVSGTANSFYSNLGTGASSIHVGSSASRTNFHGGQYGGVTIDSGAAYTTFHGVNYGFASGAFTDNGSNTLRFGCYDELNGIAIGANGDMWIGQKTPPPTLTIASNTIAPAVQTSFLGTGLVKNITVPAGFTSGSSITLIPTAAFTTDTTGNIYAASTAVIGRAMTFTYVSSTGKWYPSY